MTTAALIAAYLEDHPPCPRSSAYAHLGNTGNKIFPFARIIETVRQDGLLRFLCAEYPDGSFLELQWCADYGYTFETSPCPVTGFIPLVSEVAETASPE